MQITITLVFSIYLKYDDFAILLDNYSAVGVGYLYVNNVKMSFLWPYWRLYCFCARLTNVGRSVMDADSARFDIFSLETIKEKGYLPTLQH